MKESENIQVLYQDDYLIVVNKPAGLPVHKNDFMPRDADYLTKAIGQITGKSVYNTHRLDSKTSGIIVMAFSSEYAHDITKQFEDRAVRKKYYALVRANPGEGTFDEPVLIKKRGKKKPAVTHYKTFKSIKTQISYKEYENIDISLVEIDLETGRWHQIRQHFAKHRFDIIGDNHHGDFTLNKIIIENTGIKRLMLHAGSLEFIHPVSKEILKFETDLPHEFFEVIDFYNIDL